jgi:hypothetical protein
MSVRPARRAAPGIVEGSLACLLALAVAAAGAGCTSVGLSIGPNAAADPATCTIGVRVFDRQKDLKAGHLTPGRVESVLTSKDGAVVHRAEGADWSLPGLSPGDYRLRVRQWRKGNTDEERPDFSVTKKLPLRPGQSAAVDVVGRKVTTGAVIVSVAAVVAVVAIVAAISTQNSMNNINLQFHEQRTMEALPSGAAASPVPGALTPSPDELERLARSVARAFPE